ncbi:alpha/beta hydrolase [Nocardiopsis exhalans]|uniref:Alpha/beta hydrolase n=1 Tax=Nocardiopsis exhalans TaxID=163604 RepID=A0ABY5D5C0_9ACTN|nr:alpha/beta hydrolase [Nocardiopsis exhalans]USY18580.1 alpha/beta hydrolase [Nocardiopsis exhalans]
MTFLPPAARAEYLDLDGGRVRVLHSGPAGAPPLLLVHGGSNDNATISWYRLFEEFGADHHVIAPDLPGFGGTEGIDPLGGPVAQADFLSRLLAGLGVERAVVVGVSMGGDVAMNLALHHPELVRGLVLIAPGGLVERVGNRFTHKAAWWSTRMPDGILFPVVALANRFVGLALRAVVHDVSTMPPEVVAEFRQEALRPGAARGYMRYNQATLGPHGMRNNLLPVVGRITAPALFFHGERDPMVPLEGSRRAVRVMPNARLVTVADCGHWAQLEAHERFVEEVRSFLSDVRG